MAQYNTGTMSRRIDQLNRIAPAGYVELNRDDASQIGAVSGDVVRVTSEAGYADCARTNRHQRAEGIRIYPQPLQGYGSECPRAQQH